LNLNSGATEFQEGTLMSNDNSGGAGTVIASGLEGIVVAETGLSMVDGERGRLTYRGYNIDDLALNASFEEIMHLLWFGALPNRSELRSLESRLGEHRALSPAVIDALSHLPRLETSAPIDAVRVGVTAMAMEDPTERSYDHDDVLDKSIRMAGAIPSMLAAYVRLRRGQDIVEPASDLNTAANFLYMLNGERPTDLAATAFNRYLILVAEHSMNASTFSARVTFSTISDVYSAIASALGTLKGDAHGGANARAIEMLFEIGSVDNVDSFIEESLRVKRRLMGIGHRVYKVRDPRAKHFMELSEAVAEQIGDRTWYEIAAQVEDVTNNHPYFVERRLYPNVEFYSAPLLYMLGVPPDAMPGVFAISRISGWTANLLEQLQANRLIRPQAKYTGPESQEFVPLDERG
jgi:citrate synthase